MKIEIGKFYKTRDGRKARVYAVDGATNNPVHGAHFNNGFWYAYSWQADGRFYTDSETAYDLISEWTEPRPRMLAWINIDGCVEFVSENSLREPGIVGKFRAPWLDEPENFKGEDK